jgi:predicted adenine nucleotide alpha hydrolase (AANH) superfamily ATPase
VLRDAADPDCGDSGGRKVSTLLPRLCSTQNTRTINSLPIAAGSWPGSTGIGMYYEDFRLGWQQGIDESIRMGLYRQPYCGCIYSEQERYDKQLRRKNR